MIPLKSTVCSKTFRVPALILTCINIVLQGVCIIVCVVLFDRSTRGTWPPYDLFGPLWYYSQPLRNLLVDAFFFLGVDIFFYLLLLYGLAKRKPGPITAWLIFSVVEFIVVQATVLLITFLATISWAPGLGIFPLVADILTAIYMFYHMCVVYSARLQFINERGPRTPNPVYAHFNANAVTTNPPTVYPTTVQPIQLSVGVPQYTLAPQAFVIPATSTGINHLNSSSAIPDQKIPPSLEPPAYST